MENFELIGQKVQQSLMESVEIAKGLADDCEVLADILRDAPTRASADTVDAALRMQNAVVAEKIGLRLVSSRTVVNTGMSAQVYEMREPDQMGE
jgi:hypothetical protein